MTAILNLHNNLMIYGDSSGVLANPQRRYVDWTRHLSGFVVDNPLVRNYSIPPGGSVSVFSGSRTLVNDVNSRYSLTLNSAKSGVYRLAQTAGTVAPNFAKARTIGSLTGRNATITIYNNVTVTITFDGDAATLFGPVSVGDVLLIPGTSTGDLVGPFNVLNEGVWYVLSIADMGITLRRDASIGFQGVAETVAITDDAQLQIYQLNNVQAKDSLDIIGGFSSVSRQTYEIQTVTPKYIEFFSSEPLPLEAGAALTDADWCIYSDAKRFVHVEADQRAKVSMNGDTSESNRLDPLVPGDPDKTAIIQKWGTVWSLDIQNRSPTAWLNATVITAE